MILTGGGVPNKDTWVYPIALPNRRTPTFLFKTLISNVCVNDCKYCPLRANQDPRRCTIAAEELVRAFFDYWRAGKVMGLFLSSGVIGTPDHTMERILTIARQVRQRGFRGYMHLKVIPGAQMPQLNRRLPSRMRFHCFIETAGEQHFQALSSSKRYLEDVITTDEIDSRTHAARLAVQQSPPGATQFVVGASDESDHDILSYTAGLYHRLKLQRVYFSAYQRGLGDPTLPGEQARVSNRANY